MIPSFQTDIAQVLGGQDYRDKKDLLSALKTQAYWDTHNIINGVCMGGDFFLKSQKEILLASTKREFISHPYLWLVDEI